MIRELNILRKHGRQYIKDLDKVVLPAVFRGRPEINKDIPGQEADKILALCPNRAIRREDGLSIDLGKCVFCMECAFACPSGIRFTNDYRMAVNRPEQLIIKAGDSRLLRPDPQVIRPEIPRIFRRSLKLRQVSAGGDNSAEMELSAAGNVNFDMGRFGIEFVASPRHSDGVVVTGPISSHMVQALKITWEAIPSPKILVLAGTDAISGGIFAESQAIDRSFLTENKPDLYIPGNPPHPLTFIHGLLDLMGRK
ncbi:MAG: 4Fe-4S binding protein [Bacteroidetes bacterium]|nr:4Fe-4S binding protein [Bacteroidota bacterium]